MNKNFRLIIFIQLPNSTILILCFIQIFSTDLYFLKCVSTPYVKSFLRLTTLDFFYKTKAFDRAFWFSTVQLVLKTENITENKILTKYVHQKSKLKTSRSKTEPRNESIVLQEKKRSMHQNWSLKFGSYVNNLSLNYNYEVIIKIEIYPTLKWFKVLGNSFKSAKILISFKAYWGT